MSNPFGPEPTEGGGGFTNFEGTIIDGFFVDGEYGCSLNWVIDLTHPELYPNVESPTKLFVACGSGWSAIEAGDAVTHKDAQAGEQKAFNKKSEMGILNMRLRSGEILNFDAFAADVADRDFYRADFWKGLMFRFDEVSWDSMKKDGEEWVPTTKTRRFPVEYLGKAGGVPVASSNGQATIDPASLGLPSDLFNKLVDAAKTTTTNGAFSSAVIGAGGTAHQNLMDILADDAQVTALKAALAS